MPRVYSITCIKFVKYINQFNSQFAKTTACAFQRKIFNHKLVFGLARYTHT